MFQSSLNYCIFQKRRQTIAQKTQILDLTLKSEQWTKEIISEKVHFSLDGHSMFVRKFKMKSSRKLQRTKNKV